MNHDLFAHPVVNYAAEAQQILADVIDRFAPSHVFALFSSGNDSHCSTHVTSQHPAFSGAVLVDTQTGVPAALEHARRVCRERGWPLKEYRPPLPRFGREGETAYEAIVRHYGFPGPAQHNRIYRMLKERCVRQLVREHKRHVGDRIVLVTGVRMAESVVRMGRVAPWQREGARVWVAPLLRWQAWEKTEYMQRYDLTPNPVTEALGISGECCCGCFACPGEYERMERHYPAHAETIRRWEAIAANSGRPAEWGERPPEVIRSDPRQMGLCWSCETKQQRRASA